jgi:hypothetical protein
MDTTTLLIIVLIILLVGGGGWYGRGFFASSDARCVLFRTLFSGYFFRT